MKCKAVCPLLCTTAAAAAVGGNNKTRNKSASKRQTNMNFLLDDNQERWASLTPNGCWGPLIVPLTVAPVSVHRPPLALHHRRPLLCWPRNLHPSITPRDASAAAAPPRRASYKFANQRRRRGGTTTTLCSV